MNKKIKFNYREKQKTLEEIISLLQDGSLSIDESIKMYEESQKIILELEEYLKNAQNVIKKIK